MGLYESFQKEIETCMNAVVGCNEPHATFGAWRIILSLLGIFHRNLSIHVGQ